MCGIFGFVSTQGMTNWSDRRGFIRDATVADSLRGMDSTGYLCISNDNKRKVSLHKKDVTGSDFVDLSKTKKILRDTDKYSVIVGHNRAATKGSVSAETAHPFQFGHITGVHNGTLYTIPSKLPKTDENVDSADMFKAFADEGAVPVLERLDGSFACVWWDADKEKLFFVRNSQRPMHIAAGKDGKTALFASEKGMLMWLANRNGISLDRVYSLKEGTMLEIDPKDPCNPEVTKVKFRPAPRQTGQGYGATGWERYYNGPSVGSGRNNPHPTPNQHVGKVNKNTESRTPGDIKESLKKIGLKAGESVRVWLLDDLDSFSLWPNGGNGGAERKGHCKGLVETFTGTDITEGTVYHIPAKVFDDYESIIATVTGYAPLPGSSEYGPSLRFVKGEQLFIPDDKDKTEAALEEMEADSMMQGPGGVWMYREELDQLLRKYKNACQECSSDLFVDIDNIYWRDTDTGSVPVCEDCHTKEEKDNVTPMPHTNLH